MPKILSSLSAHLKDAPMWIVRIILGLIIMAIAWFIGWFIGTLIPPIVTIVIIAVLGMACFLGLAYIGFFHLYKHTLSALWIYLDHKIVMFFKGDEIHKCVTKLFEQVDIEPNHVEPCPA